MDLFQEGKSLAQQGNYEDALDAFMLALENDKENPDIHFYLGLCYSSLEEFRFARYHYEMALTLNPNHEKTNLVFSGLKGIEPEKPPERKMTRKAAAKIRRAQSHEAQPEDSSDPSSASSSPTSAMRQNHSHYKLTEEKWENAFPADKLIQPEKNGVLIKIFIMIAGIITVAAIVFFVLSILG
ncbi:MAG: tetratricopeptide repeat protein [Candidatus Omnitrophica bacterium]|nr:tetratricopeptide repeat protein [Candidatus Omnitrophota bacterium]